MPKINNPLNMKGEALISKQNLGLGANDVLVTSGYTAEDKVINAQWLPEITGLEKNVSGQMETVVKTMGPRINFVGDCAVRQNADGTITIRIGENLNSSNFMTKDGKTTGVDDTKITPPTATAGTLSNGTSVNAIPSGNYTINTSTDGAKIHFNNATDTTFEVVVLDDTSEKCYTFGPVTGDGTYPGKINGEEVAGVSMTISNFGKETYSDEGATGFCGSVSFTIAASAIAGGNTSSVAIKSVTHINGAEGKFIDDELGTTTCYFYTDTNTKPSIVAGAVSVTPGATKFVSGVKYLKSATANYSVSFTDIANPVCIASNVVFDSTFSADSTQSAKGTATSATGSGAVSTGMYAAASNKVKVTVKNINGNAQATYAVPSGGYSLLVDTNNTADTALSAYFDTEDNANYPRLTNDPVSGLIAFDNTKSIKTTSDLMQISGTLIYPAGNFTGYNAFLDSDFTQPDYSTGLITGKRTWYRKFFEAGDKMGATLTFVAASNIKATDFGKTLTVRIGKIAADGSFAWYDATKKDTESEVGIATSVETNKLTVNWGIYGATKTGIIVELGMTAASHIIKTLTVAFA